MIARAAAHDLPMRISDTEWQWDRNRLTIYFTADKRVDFRTLVRELATGRFIAQAENEVVAGLSAKKQTAYYDNRLNPDV